MLFERRARAPAAGGAATARCALGARVGVARVGVLREGNGWSRGSLEYSGGGEEGRVRINKIILRLVDVDTVSIVR